MADCVDTYWNSSSNAKWVNCDITQLGGILANEKALQEHVRSLENDKEITYQSQQKPEQFKYPELVCAGEVSVNSVIDGLMNGITSAASVAGVTPSTLLNDR